MKSVKAFLTLNLCGPVELLIVHSYATLLVVDCVHPNYGNSRH